MEETLLMKKNFYFEIAPEVQNAVRGGMPVVALESATACCGIPYPQSAQVLRKAEEVVRGEGAVPATIAVLGGKIKVGLTAEEIERLAKKGKSAARASKKDIPILIAKEEDGAATISAAAMIAEMAGIKVLASGIVGGVLRGEGNNADVSADIEAVSENDIAVVCAGIESVYDIDLTLEYLETKGVPAVGFGTKELPGFYCRESGFGVDYEIDEPEELAAAVKAKHDLGIKSGILVANPVPREHAMNKNQADMVIERAVKAASDNGIKGKELPTFLMALIKEMTGGMSLDTTVEVILNNARVAAKTAYSLAALGSDEEDECDELLRAEIADDTAESIGREINAFRSEVENIINQRMAAMPVNPYMNPYMNPYQQQPNPYQPNPYQQAPFQNPYQPAPQQQPPFQPAPQPAPMPYVNPYKPVRQEPEPVAEPEIPVYDPNKYKVPDDQWVNPFAPKHDNEPEKAAEPEEKIEETPAGGDSPVIANTAPEVMQMVEDSVEEAKEEEAPAEETVEEVSAEEEAAPEVPEEAEETEEAPAEEAPVEEAPAEAEETSGEDENTLTEYVPPVHEKKKRKPDNMEKPEMDGEGMTSYDPEFYRKRAEERKQRLSEAAGESKHVEEAKAAEPEYVDCKGPLEFTGEHPWAWKCTRCGQLFQKHEIPHKCVKTE